MFHTLVPRASVRYNWKQTVRPGNVFPVINSCENIGPRRGVAFVPQSARCINEWAFGLRAHINDGRLNSSHADTCDAHHEIRAIGGSVARLFMISRPTSMVQFFR
ncbi:hypothetical protein AVEN_74080-1 [Araneus ventricosus]|uniref:Uncharacterized protein n=1 Tax=Araneus ventricosus TaxID=182803 RepID=A0A4Y2DAU2_ARAVE|nr:hypothetical protein AVEN_74080-1 [Araneus ventricosus]